jgi:hypothetical protein
MLLSSIHAEAQVATVQDCLGAIPICQDSTFQAIAFSGTGNYPNEISYPASCLQAGEKNDVWYLLRIQKGGIINFTLTPVNPNDDYDWAIFNITNNICSDIVTALIQVSCNYAGNNGFGGMTGANGGTNQQSSPTFNVATGNVYVLNVSNYSATQGGYLLDFSASTADLRDTVNPRIDSTYSTLHYGDSAIAILFSENVYGNSIQPSDFTLSGPGGPYTITSVDTTAANINGYSKNYTIYFSPPVSMTGNFTLGLIGSVSDLCNNTALPENFSLTVSMAGINSLKGKSNFEIFPNPAGNEFLISFSAKKNNSEIVIRDIAGQIIYLTHANEHQLIVHSEDFSEGIYFIQNTSDGFTEIKKLIVVRQ